MPSKIAKRTASPTSPPISEERTSTMASIRRTALMRRNSLRKAEILVSNWCVPPPVGQRPGARAGARMILVPPYGRDHARRERMARMTPLRITMVNKYYWPPHLGGVEAVVRISRRGSSSTPAPRCAPWSATRAATRVEETIGGVDVVRLPRQLALSSAPVAAGMPGALARRERRRPDATRRHQPARALPVGRALVPAGAPRRAQRRALPQRHRAPEAPARRVSALPGAVSR